MTSVFVAGELVDAESARLSVFDHGLVVGDGVFETILVRNGRPFALSRHLDRLERSASDLGIRLASRYEVESAVKEVLASSGQPSRLARLRVIWTSGPGRLCSLRGSGPGSLIVALEPEPETPPTSRVAIAPWTRNERGALAGIKSTSYAENARALAWAVARGADEAIFANTAGELCEGTGSNVFYVIGGVLSTPPTASGCLAGVTRAILIELSGAGESKLAIEKFSAELLDEAFLTSSVRGVQPISAIDGRPLAGAPGPVTSRLAEEFAGVLAATDGI